MTKLIANIFLTSLPMLLLLAYYVLDDPFEVIYHYDKHGKNPNIVLDRDFISIDLLKNKAKFAKYDSFVLGNSRSLAFTCADWINYINTDGCFHLDASNESLFGINKKIEYLEKNNFKIRNALIILDISTLVQIDNDIERIFIKHPDTTKESMIDFQIINLKAFFEPVFLVGYLDYKMTGTIRPRFKSRFQEYRFIHNPSSNDLLFEREKDIMAGTYYNNMKHIFYKRAAETKYSEPTIKIAQKQMLKRIKYILDAQHTSYKIIISPLYDQLKISKDDLYELESVFGKKDVFDYSGINKYTADFLNYYETSHYRRHVGKMILGEVYSLN